MIALRRRVAQMRLRWFSDRSGPLQWLSDRIGPEGDVAGRNENGRCETCRYWAWGIPKPAEEEVDTSYGSCHRHAPMPFFSIRDRGSQARQTDPGDDTTIWPVTHFTDWCGEWEETD